MYPHSNKRIDFAGGGHLPFRARTYSTGCLEAQMQSASHCNEASPLPMHSSCCNPHRISTLLPQLATLYPLQTSRRAAPLYMPFVIPQFWGPFSPQPRLEHLRGFSDLQPSPYGPKGSFKQSRLVRAHEPFGHFWAVTPPHKWLGRGGIEPQYWIFATLHWGTPSCVNPLALQLLFNQWSSGKGLYYNGKLSLFFPALHHFPVILSSVMQVFKQRNNQGHEHTTESRATQICPHRR